MTGSNNSTPVDRFVDHPSLDYLAGLAVTVAYARLTTWRPSWDALAALSTSERRDLYSWSAVIVSLLATVVTVAVGQSNLATGPRMAQLARSHGNVLAKTWRAMLVASLFAVVATFVVLLVDAHDASACVVRTATLVFTFAMATTGTRFLRAIVLFERIYGVSMRDASHTPVEPVPAPTSVSPPRRDESADLEEDTKGS
jgi:hypothetical protein